MKKGKTILTAVLAALLLCGCGRDEVQPYDPYQGMVQVPSGYGTLMWVEEYEDVPVSSFQSEDFVNVGGRMEYTGDGYEGRTGIDVSEHQGLIDWEAVAADGIDFAIIRAGYRGYSEGGLFVDQYFFENMNGAVENGIDIGIYFFSQATSAEEAVEEAEFLIDTMLSLYITETFALPIFYDWEAIGTDQARTDGMSGEAITQCALAFCQAIESAGYTAGIYAYRDLAYYSYDLSAIQGYPLWMGALGSWPDFYYEHQVWQYSVAGEVDGIEGEVDLNLLLVKDAAEETATEWESVSE